MVKRKTMIPNVKNGIAVPLGNDYYLMRGPKHENGGIDVGENLEVEGGEILKMTPKSIKVLSNSKMLGEITPAEYALGGLNNGTFEKRFNKAFKYQEDFKDKHKLNDDGTKARFGKNKTVVNRKKVEDVIRSSGGITGDFFNLTKPIIDFNQLSHAINAGLVGLGLKKPVAEDRNYTGVAMEGKGLITDDGLGFVSTQDLIDELGEKPVDFVDAYITGQIPFVKQGVSRKENAEEKRVYDKTLKKRNLQNIQVFQTHKDTLDNATLALLNDRLARGKYSYFSENTTRKNSPFKIGDTGLIYDGNNATTIRTVLPDGRVFYKTNDIFDTNVKEWNYDVGPMAKIGLGYIDKNTTPYMMTTPWYQKKDDTDVWRRMKDVFGIYLDSNGTLQNTGDSEGKIWEVEEALKWIDEHPYELDYKGAKDKEYNKLGGMNKIEIKPSKRGSFTRAAKERGISLAELSRRIDANPEQYSPAMRKKNNFYNNFVENRKSKKLVGGTIPSTGEKKKAFLGIKLNENVTDFLEANPNFVGGAIQGITNILGSGLTSLYNNRMLNSLEYRPRPTLLSADKLKTTYNINPQLRAINDTFNKYKKYIDKNTTSSQIAVGRYNLGQLDMLGNTLNANAQKEMAETQLINQDIANRQSVVQRNITNYDNWLAGKYDFENAIKEQKSEQTANLIQTGARAVNDFITGNAQWKQNMMNISALSAAYPDVTPEKLASVGIPYPLYMKKRMERRKTKNNTTPNVNENKE